jgi:hypothetical protein
MCFCTACGLALYFGQWCPVHGVEYIDWRCPEITPEYGEISLWHRLQWSYEHGNAFVEEARRNGLEQWVECLTCHEDAATDLLVRGDRGTAGVPVQFKGTTIDGAYFDCSRGACTTLQSVGGQHALYVFYKHRQDMRVNSSWLQRQCDGGGMQVWAAAASWVLQQRGQQQGARIHVRQTALITAAAAAAAEEAQHAGVTDLVQRLQRFGVIQLQCNSSQALGRQLAHLFHGLLARVSQDVPPGITVIEQMCRVSLPQPPPPPPLTE